MKEEFIKLRKEANEYLKQKEILKKQRLFFNMKVEEQQSEYKLPSRGNMDAYEEAKIFEDVHQEIAELTEEVKQEHPKYGQKRIRNMVLEKFMENSNFEEAQLPIAEALIDSYYLYESCGYQKVRSQEKLLKELEQKINTSTQEICSHPKQILTNVTTTAVNMIKPYKEVAKGQLQDVKITSKKVIHKSCKKLRKVLKKVEDRTKEEI